jgi:alditol oxidase
VKNWSGTHTYRARGLHRPASVEELREIVARAPRVRVLGSRHSFTDIADSDELVSLEALPAEVEIEGGQVSFCAGLRYGELAEALQAEALALHNLASLPHISVAGAVATATHGSGDANGNLATAVAALELVTSAGELVRAARGDEDFDGTVVGLGALGAVTRIVLDAEPLYEVAQRVFEGLAWEELYEHFDAITGSGYSVSVLSYLGDAVDQVWVRSRVTDAPEVVREDLFGARPATVDRHPILGLDPVNCTPQLGRPGPWSGRLPYFRMGFTPSAGEELQSEYLVAREQALPAIEAVRALADRIRPVLHVCEIRTVAADRLWMSPEYERDSVGIHFTWALEPEAVPDVVADLEPALEPFDPRPHWGKLFLRAPRYERVPDFARLAETLDPRGAFRNAWLEARVLGN